MQNEAQRVGAVLFVSTEGKRRIKQGVHTAQSGVWAKFSVDTCCENIFANAHWKQEYHR